MALKQTDDPNQPEDIDALPLADSRRMKKEIEQERDENDVMSPGPQPIVPGEEVPDPSLSGNDDPGWMRRVQRPQRFAAASMNDATPAPDLEDFSNAYVQMAQQRTTDAEIEELYRETDRIRSKEFEKPKQAIPFINPASGAATAEGAGSLPWYKHKTVAEVYQAVLNNAASMTGQDVLNTSLAAGKDIAKGILWESPRWIARGATTAAREFVATGAEFQNWMFAQVPIQGLKLIKPELKEAGFDLDLYDKVATELKNNLTNMIPKADQVLDKPTTYTAGFGEEAVRFIVSFIPTFKAMQAANVGSRFGTLGSRVGPATKEALDFARSRTGRFFDYLKTVGGASTVAEGVTHPADDPNIASLVEVAPAFSNVVTQALQTNPNDSVGWAKIKSAISDGFISGVIADGVLQGLRWMSAKQKVVPEIEALERLHGNQPSGTILAEGPDAQLISRDGPPPSSPFTLDVSTPEARSNAEGTLRDLLQGDGGVRIEAQPIYDDIFDQLRAAGLPEDQAAANARVWAQRYATRADRLGDGRSAIDLYREENVNVNRPIERVAREELARPDAEVLNQEAPIPPHVQRLYEEGHIVSDGGAMQDITDLREMIRRKATPEEIENNPIISAAYRRGNEGTPTFDDPNFGTPEWRANRQFNIEGQTVVGYPAAQKWLYHNFTTQAGVPIKNERKVVIVTGPGGAGKSTIMKPLSHEYGAAIIDVDEAKPLFPEYDGGVGANRVHEESSFITFMRGGPMDQLLDEGANMLIQKIGHTPASLRRLKAQLEAEGYTVSTVNVKVDPDEAFRRRISRYLRTGRINSNGYNHSLAENGDQPLKTHDLLVREGFYEEAVQIDLNGRTPKILSGEGTNLAKLLRPVLGPAEGGIDVGPGQRRSDGLLPGQAVPGSAEGVSFNQGGVIRGAAVEINGKIFEANSHFDAIMKAMDQGIDINDIPVGRLREGFISKDGAFISRSQAADLVGSHTERLVSEDLRMNGGEFDQSQPFYSSVERTIASSTQKSATGAQWLAALRNTPGIKKEEIEWLGIDRFLSENKGQVSKADVEAYVAANRVEIKEVRKQDMGDVTDLAYEQADVILARWKDDPRVQARVKEDGGRFDVVDDHDNILVTVNSRKNAERQATEFNLAIRNKDWDVLQDWSLEIAEKQISDIGAAKFPNLQLPGGENYRELLLTLPERASKPVHQNADGSWSIQGDRFKFKSQEAAQEASRTSGGSRSNNYTYGHYDEPNVLAHARMNDRIIDGKKTLFIEEIQSDWHQQGRRRGYISRPLEEIQAEMKPFEKKYRQGKLSKNELAEYEKLLSEFKAHKEDGVLDAPFKKTWHELMMKRLIRLAVDEGYEQIAWTTGRQQSDRYDLSKQIKNLNWTRYADGTYHLDGETTSGGMHNFGTGIREDKLETFVGKDVADKIISEKGTPAGRQGTVTGTLSGTDLSVGKEGMVGFYDKMLPAAADAIGKPFGAKAGRGEFNVNNGEVALEKILDPYVENKAALRNFIEDFEGNRHNIGPGKTWKDIDDFLDDSLPFGSEIPGLRSALEKYLEGKPEQVHTLPITPELAKTAKEQGFRLFQSDESVQPPLPGSAEPRGRITLGENQTLIQLFKRADASTFMHESAHLWLDELRRDADVSPQMKADFDETLRWLGVDNADAITREHHEKWAASFEQYLLKGEAPSEALKGVFERFKDWLVSIYRTIAGIGEGAINPEIQAVFDRMLASDPELAASGRRRIFDETGAIAPELSPLIQSRLGQAGHDALIMQSANGPLVQRFDPSQMAALRKIDDAFRTTEPGVPTGVVAQGMAGSATDAASRAGVARVLRASDEPVGTAPNIYINFGRINTPDDAKQVIRDMADAFRDEISEGARGIQTNEQTARLADQMGMTVEDLLNRQRGQPFNAEQSLAARRLLTTSAEQLRTLAEKAALPNSSLADQYNFRKMLAIHHAIQSEVLAARTETARALQAWSINAGSNIEMARDIQSLIDSMGGSKTAQQIAQATADLFKAGVPPGAIADMTRRGWWATGIEVVREMFTLGLLWAPPTHIANFGGNLVTAHMQVHERALTRVIGDMLDTGEGRIVSGEALAMLYGQVSAIKDAFIMAGRAFRDGGDTGSISHGSKLDQPMGAISSATFSRERGHTILEAEKFAQSPMGRFLDFLGGAARTPGRFLAAEDEFAKAIIWRGEVHAQALRQATAEGGSFAERIARMRELTNNPPEHIRLAAVDAATYATFQSKMGEIGQGLMKLRSGRLSAGFMVLPFIKTPTNILAYAFEHSPLAFTVARWRDDIAAGGGRRDLALARMATGTAIMATALDYASNGYITGSGPSDPGRREALIRTGWQPNSLKIGDKYYSFQRGDPIGLLMGFSGTLAERMAASEISPEKYDAAQEIIAALIGTISASVVDKSYLRGVEGIIRAIQQSEQGSGGFESFVNQQTGSLLPFSSAFNFHRRWVDPVSREVHSPLDAIKNKIAEWSVGLPPKRDLWGEEIRLNEVYGRAYDLLSPVAVSQAKDSPIDREIIRLNTSVRKIQYKDSFDGVQINFHEWPEVYDRYVQLAGNEWKHPAHNAGLKDFLNAVVSGRSEYSDHYQNFHSEGEHGGKAAWIKNQVTAFRKGAQRHIMTEEAHLFPEFVAFVNAQKAQMIELRRPIPAQGQQ